MEQQPKIEEVVDKELTKNQMTLLLKKDKLGVFIKLLETDTRPTSQRNLLLRKIARNRTKRMNNWYRRNIMNIWTSSAKKRHTAFLNRDLGITRSK
jgi:hypothetical protein